MGLKLECIGAVRQRLPAGAFLSKTPGDGSSRACSLTSCLGRACVFAGALAVLFRRAQAQGTGGFLQVQQTSKLQRRSFWTGQRIWAMSAQGYERQGSRGRCISYAQGPSFQEGPCSLLPLFLSRSFLAVRLPTSLFATAWAFPVATGGAAPYRLRNVEVQSGRANALALSSPESSASILRRYR